MLPVFIEHVGPMKIKQTPIDRPGMKNPFCVFFKECILRAFNHQWEDWSCSECLLKHAEDPVPAQTV